eukprot:CAMPEP_0117690578 /NCGR_PEP_ID=MMETSP0804-20121206/25206_1 /TAXON_ID=1074897 /ORGANISM="Tetraselmis astigmatica, Strain CCMP880" /LENGTH=56 /DNA_ID=CAMNT_0005503643 /DNA_START=398 /DNA_END=568 /DNA_ORIENTATION=-
MITQYFDTIKEIGTNGRSNTVFMPHQPGGVGDVAAQIRNGFMEASAGQTMSRQHQA